jgi:[ribosomal protein S5]-alanine N-acetyltransferase
MKLRLIEIAQDGTPARCPGHIPPSGRDVIEGTVVMYEALGFQPPWIGYLADRDGDIVGACTFKGPPQDGRVEIAYMTFPEFEGRGVATEMVRQLVKLAQDHDPRLTLSAQTPQQEGASTVILRRLGFVLHGPITDADESPLWQWLRVPEDASHE